MSNKTIAVDVDDVLAASAAGFVAFSNKRWGTNLVPDDYDERWSEMWQVDHDETERRAVEFHASGEMGKYSHLEEAKTVLENLRRNFRLVIVTSRRRIVAQETAKWIDRSFPGFFADIHHAGFWDNGRRGAHVMTKADLCKEIDADYLVDDQVKHCFAAVDVGVTAVLFGDYPWNHVKEKGLPSGVVRCKDWFAVEEFFERERR